MPFNGSGTYSPPSPPNFPAIAGNVITAAYYNTVINDIASGLSLCLTRDGQAGPTGPISWNAQNLTNVANLGAVTATFSGAVTLSGAVTFGSTINVTTNATIGGTLGVTGAVTLSSTLTATGNTTLNGTLAVAGASTFAGQPTLNNDVYLGAKNSSGTVGRLIGTGSSNVVYVGDIDNIGGPVVLRSGGADTIYLTDAGNVGIGNSNPAGKLDLAGGEFVTDNGRSIGWRNSGGSTLLMLTLTGANNFQYGPSGAFTGRHEWYTGGSLVMAISNGGFLGIGGLPNFRLDVRGSSDTTHALISGVSKAIRFQTTTADSAIEGVDQTGGGSYQPLTVGGSQVSVSQSGSEVARFSSTNLRVLGNVFVGSVSAGNQLATLASPTFTGTPAAPTAANGTNTTQIATTAFVQSQLTANAYAPIASPNFSGTAQYGSLEIGYRDIPRVTGGIDRGKCNAISAGLTLNTGPAAGSTYSIYNDSAAAVTITQGAGLTLRLGGTATTGNRTLAARGFATVWYNSTTEAIIQGSGVT